MDMLIILIDRLLLVQYLVVHSLSAYVKIILKFHQGCSRVTCANHSHRSCLPASPSCQEVRPTLSRHIRLRPSALPAPRFRCQAQQFCFHRQCRLVGMISPLLSLSHCTNPTPALLCCPQCQPCAARSANPVLLLT